MEFGTCRVCLNKSATISLFEDHHGIKYSNKIMKCVRIDISHEDALPKFICQTCVNELTISYEFVVKCERSDNALRYIGSGLSIKEEFEDTAFSDVPDDFDCHSLPENATLSDAPVHFASQTASSINDSNNDITMKTEENSFTLDNISEDMKIPNKVESNVKRLKTVVLKCAICEQAVISRSAMAAHMRTHTGEKPFKCDICMAQFRAKGSLKRHLELKHSCETEKLKGNTLHSDHESILNSKPQNYSKKYNNTSKVKRDKRANSRSKSGPLQCVICGQITMSRSAMEAHMRTHTGEKPFICQDCMSQFRTKGSLKRHIESRHSNRERKFTCETCGSNFFRKNDIVIHMRVHTNERPYICPYCPKRFGQISSLIRHKRRHTGEKPFGCTICGKKFSDKNMVKKHQLVHTNEKKYSCQLCEKSVKSKNALKTHMILHSNEKQFICSFCGMAFSMKGNLQTHIRRVHSEKSGQCSVCLKTCSDLEVHMRVHTGEKPFMCKICSKSFATQRSLSHHIVFKHENSTKFKCSIGECTKTFPTAMMLEFHLLKQHTNNTPYVCQHCSRGFFRTSDLSRHLRVSHLDVHLKIPVKYAEVDA